MQTVNWRIARQKPATPPRSHGACSFVTGDINSNTLDGRRVANHIIPFFPTTNPTKPPGRLSTEVRRGDSLLELQRKSGMRAVFPKQSTSAKYSILRTFPSCRKHQYQSPGQCDPSRIIFSQHASHASHRTCYRESLRQILEREHLRRIVKSLVHLTVHQNARTGTPTDVHLTNAFPASSRNPCVPPTNYTFEPS